MSKRLRAGNIGINTTQRNHNTPFGGTKFSGVGRDGGVFGLHAYTDLQSVVWPRDSADESSVVPDGQLAYGMQLPVQSLSVRVSMPWEQDGHARRHGARRAGVRRRRLPLRRGVPSRCDPARAGRDDVDAVVRPVATLGVPRRAHDEHAADEQRVRRRVPASARRGEGSSRRSTSLERAHHLRHRRRPRRRRVRRARCVVQGRGEGRRRAGGIKDALTNEWIDDVGQRPRPVQQPHPPIWIGGSGRPALRRVAHLGDGWIPQATTLDQFAARHRMDPPRRDEVRPGAVPEIGYHLVAHVGDPTWEFPKGVMQGAREIVDFAN